MKIVLVAPLSYMHIKCRHAKYGCYNMWHNVLASPNSIEFLERFHMENDPKREENLKKKNLD